MLGACVPDENSLGWRRGMCPKKSSLLLSSCTGWKYAYYRDFTTSSAIKHIWFVMRLDCGLYGMTENNFSLEKKGILPLPSFATFNEK